MSQTEILVDVEPVPNAAEPAACATFAPTPPAPAHSAAYTEINGANSDAVPPAPIGTDGGTPASSSVTAAAAAAAAAATAADPPSYQNQTAADIESGRSRLDSYGSGGSEDSLIPATKALSPRRSNRENRPLLVDKRRPTGRSQYEEIEEALNVYSGRTS